MTTSVLSNPFDNIENISVQAGSSLFDLNRLGVCINLLYNKKKVIKKLI